ncbi:MAG: hypothetical protein H7315_05920 [Herminiimonas sp.]|nr:hypothetical protein [Herminiimonas sp.]
MATLLRSQSQFARHDAWTDPEMRPSAGALLQQRAKPCMEIGKSAQRFAFNLE